jgi:hypothetical protein
MKSIKYTDLLLEEMEKNLMKKEDANNCEIKELLDYIKETEKPDIDVIQQIASKCKVSLQEMIEVICQVLHRCLNKEGVLEEMMSTSTAAGGEEYATPAAFSKSGEVSDKIKKISTMFGMKPVPKTNRWFKELDKDTGKPLNEGLTFDTSLYKRMVKTINGDI